MTNATLTIFSLSAFGSVAFCLRLADNGVRGFGKTRRIPGQQFRQCGLDGGRRSEPFCEVAPRVMKRPRLLSRCRLLVPSRFVSASRTMVSAVLIKHGGYPGSSSGSVDWTGEDDRRGGACSSRRYGAIMATRALAVDKGLLCMYISPAKILRLTLRMTGRARSNIMT